MSAVSRSLGRRAAAALAVAVSLAALVVIADPAAATTRTLYVNVGGTGDCATPTQACGSIDAAFSRAAAGDRIELAAGTYPSQVVASGKLRSTDFAANVVVEPAAGAAVTVNGLTVLVHHLTVRGLTVMRVLMTDRFVASRDLRFEALNFVNATAFLRGLKGGALVDSTFRDGLNRDAMNVTSGSTDVLIARNRFVDYRWDPNKPNADIHIDCIQVFGVIRLTIDSNSFDNCSQRAIIILTASGSNDGVLVVNNFVGPCDQADNICQTKNVPFQATGPISALQRNPASTGTANDYTIVNNQIVGWAFVEDVPGLRFANNILNRFFHEVPGQEICGRPSEFNNLVAALGRCLTLSRTDRLSGTMTAWATQDLGFADAALAPVTDHDGRPRCDQPDVGAYEMQCGSDVPWRLAIPH